MLSKQKGKRHFMSVALPNGIKVGLSMMVHIVVRAKRCHLLIARGKSQIRKR